MDDKQQRRPATIRRGNAAPLETEWRSEDDGQPSDHASGSHAIFDNRGARYGCGCILPALFLLGSLGTLASRGTYGASPAQEIGELTGIILAGIALVWVPIYLFWMRRSNRWLIAGSFALIIAFFLVLGLGKIGSGYSATTKDLDAVSNIAFDAEGNPVLPKGMAESGPMSKLMSGLVAEQNKMRSDYEAETAKLDFDPMMDAGKVVRNSALVQNCRRFTDFKSVIATHRARNIAFANNVPVKIEALDVPASAKAQIKAGAMKNQERNLGSIEKQWAGQEKSIAPMHRACLILSKRNWKAQGKMFAFFNPADTKAFNGSMGELKALDAELVALNNARLDSAKAGQDRLKSLVQPRP